MTDMEKSVPSAQIEVVDFSGHISHLVQTHARCIELLKSGASTSTLQGDEMLSPQSQLSQASNFLMIDSQGVRRELLSEEADTALQAAIRFHLLDSLAIGSTPESYELYDLIDDPAGFMASVDGLLDEKSVAVRGSFEKVSEFARHIAYSKEYNDALFARITFSERRELFEAAAFLLSEPYFDKLQTLTGGAR